MYSGIALYGIESISPALALEIGISFFNAMNIDITSTGYHINIEDDNSEEDLEVITAPLSTLKEKLEKGEKLTFRVFSEDEKNIPWLASFGYSTNEFGNFYHIDMQCPSKDGKIILDFIRNILDGIIFSYGIVYSFNKMTDSYFYASGGNLLTKYTNESPSAFSRETPGRFRGRTRYNNSMLRMIYPINIINEDHLQIDVKGKTLNEWILSNECHGKLERLNEKLWLWIVDENILDDLNNYCGEAGILIAWELQAKKRKPKLP
ncbi:hypothetical protein [Leminorella grimontii]|uniref:hypothetical protein n=1 Tax=Leminorella grimontii TaxID=82981 RepID=UPI0020858DDB|nr:hypothetical protein [Leminorella grimontii]GKX60217.1 hypothetical protein SOASR031_25320 [Leminorella grimontii]